jgi:hypothetical protein
VGSDYEHVMKANFQLSVGFLSEESEGRAEMKTACGKKKWIPHAHCASIDVDRKASIHRKFMVR